MDRSIIIRAYNTTMKKFVYMAIQTGSYYVSIPTNEGGKLEPRQQRTGLKDSKGKDIYENDVVRIEVDTSPESLETHDVFQVIFKDGCFCIDIDEDSYPLCEYLHQALEVVGNIYEDDLLPKPTNE